MAPAMATITRTEVAICVGSDLFPWRVSAQHDGNAGERIEYIAVDKSSWSLAHCAVQRLSKQRLCTMFGSGQCVIDELRSARERATFTELSPILAESLMQSLHGKNGARKRKRMMDSVVAPDTMGWVRVIVRGVEYTLKATANSRSSIFMKLDAAVVAGFIEAFVDVVMLGWVCVHMIYELCVCWVGYTDFRQIINALCVRM